MTSNAATNRRQWLSGQGVVVANVLEETLEEMQREGFRIRAGSTPLRLERGDEHRRASIGPVRFSLGGEDSLRLLVEATTKLARDRYVVAVRATGNLVLDAFQQLASRNPEAWAEAYLTTGLWITRSGINQPFQRLSQINEDKGDDVQIAAVFPPLQVERTLKQATMTLGVLYRSVIDEFSGSSRMASLVAHLKTVLGGYLPRFQRLLPP